MRVLALNDDNHAHSFRTENGEEYTDPFTFMVKCLALPHNETYEIREFSIYDDVTRNGVLLPPDVVSDLFDFVAGICSFPYGIDISFEEAFDLLWEAASPIR